MKCIVCGNEIKINVNDRDVLISSPAYVYDYEGNELEVHRRKCEDIARNRFNQEYKRKEWGKKIKKAREIKKYFSSEKALINGKWYKITGRWKEDMLNGFDSGFYLEDENKEKIQVSHQFIEEVR